jgi:IS5 family transposase
MSTREEAIAMKQMSLAAAAGRTAGFEKYRKPTRRDAFLAEMQTLVAWSDLVALIGLWPKLSSAQTVHVLHGHRHAGRGVPEVSARGDRPVRDHAAWRAALPEGRQRASADRLGAHVAHSFAAALVQPGRRGLRRSLYDSAALRGFVGIDLGREPVPDATTILKFRRLLEKHDLGQAIFAEVGRILQGRGLRLSAGTIVDATIIAAPSSTKNVEQQRDPEMRQTKKGNR